MAIEEVSIDKLVVADDNVRADVGDVSELAASILANGVIAPLVVREGDYVVVAGTRRLAAAKKAGLEVVPVIVRAFTEQERLQVMLVENLQREDLTPLEEAAGFARLSEMGLSQKDVAKLVGCSQTHVSRRLGLLALPFSVQLNVNAGQITSEEATELVKLKDDPDLVEAVVKQKQSGGQYAPPIANTVRRETEKRRRAQKVEDELKKLEKAGVTAVALVGDQYGSFVRPPAGFAMVVEEAYRSDEVKADPVKHRRMKCHAVGIKPNDAEHVELCSDPSKHPSPADERKAEEDKRKAEAEAAKKAWVESIERRREFVAGYVRGKVSVDVALKLAWTALAEQSMGFYGTEDADELACWFLGIELNDVQQDEDGDGTVTLDAVDELSRLVLNSTADRVRAIAALSAAKLENTTANTYGRWGLAERSYVEVLKSVGYEPSAPELAELVVEAAA